VTFLPDDLIEGYTSLIWTERMGDAGGFELMTPDIDQTAALIPEDSLLTLRDSNEVMIVESHNLIRNAEGGAELKIVGSSYETMLQRRIMVAVAYKKPWATLKTYRGPELISLLMWNHLVNATGEDPTRAAQTMDAKGAIPNVIVTDSSTITGALESWSLEEGEVYSRLRDFLELSDLGIRTIRPTKTTANVMSFDTTRTASRGNVSKVVTGDISQLRLDVYNGLDRTKDQTDRPVVIFHYSAGHIDDAQYLISHKDYRNIATVVTSVGNYVIVPHTIPTQDPNVTGADRRMLWVDGGDKGDQDQTTFLAAAMQKGYIELAKHSKVVMFDGAISDMAPYKYNVDYFLGDRVSLIGEFGFEETMLISEYIRTQDINGERGYPGLARRLEYDADTSRTAKTLVPE
jgi:hypothetical protein